MCCCSLFSEEKEYWKILDDKQPHGILWQPEAVVGDMKHSKDPASGLYLMDASEFFKLCTVRSFFSRKKASRYHLNNQDRLLL
jgi:hypothetical protein